MLIYHLILLREPCPKVVYAISFNISTLKVVILMLR